MHTLSILATALLTITGASAAADPKCPDFISDRFFIHNRKQTSLYNVQAQPKRAPNKSFTTKHSTRAGAGVSGIRKVDDKYVNVKNIPQLTYYYQVPHSSEVRAYGAYIKHETGSAIYFRDDHAAALKAGYDIVTANYKPKKCELVLAAPAFRDLTTNYVFDCDGKLWLGDDEFRPDCPRVFITPGNILA